MCCWLLCVVVVLFVLVGDPSVCLFVYCVLFCFVLYKLRKRFQGKTRKVLGFGASANCFVTGILSQIDIVVEQAKADRNLILRTATVNAFQIK